MWVDIKQCSSEDWAHLVQVTTELWVTARDSQQTPIHLSVKMHRPAKSSPKPGKHFLKKGFKL